MFDFPEDEDDSELRLSIGIQEKLQATLGHLVSSARLVDASPENLRRRTPPVREPAVEAAQTVNLRIEPDPTEEDINVWLSRLHGESGAASACTFIYVALGNLNRRNLLTSNSCMAPQCAS